jgi:hypothetical protein
VPQDALRNDAHRSRAMRFLLSPHPTNCKTTRKGTVAPAKLAEVKAKILALIGKP